MKSSGSSYGQQTLSSCVTVSCSFYFSVRKKSGSGWPTVPLTVRIFHYKKSVSCQQNRARNQIIGHGRLKHFFRRFCSNGTFCGKWSTKTKILTFSNIPVITRRNKTTNYTVSEFFPFVLKLPLLILNCWAVPPKEITKFLETQTGSTTETH